MKNNWQKIRNGICRRRRQPKQGRKSPNLTIQSTTQIRRQAKRFRNRITTILFNARHDEIRLFLIQKSQSEGFTLLRCIFWEIGNGEGADDGYGAGDEALHDENPSPTSDAFHHAGPEGRVGFGGTVVLTVVWAEISEAVHLHEAVCSLLA